MRLSTSTVFAIAITHLLELKLKKVAKITLAGVSFDRWVVD
jgi:hypothetical protein